MIHAFIVLDHIYSWVVLSLQLILYLNATVGTGTLQLNLEYNFTATDPERPLWSLENLFIIS